MTDAVEQRLVRLEELVAHQSSAIEDLSRQLADSWKSANWLRGELTRLTERFQDIEDGTGDPPANQPPPHW